MISLNLTISAYIIFSSSIFSILLVSKAECASAAKLETKKVMTLVST